MEDAMTTGTPRPLISYADARKMADIERALALCDLVREFRRFWFGAKGLVKSL